MISVKEGDNVYYYVKIAGGHDKKDGIVDRVYRPLFGRRTVAVKDSHSDMIDIIPAAQITGKRP
jgi:hypothetical protein